MTDVSFAELLRTVRADRCVSLTELAGQIHYSRTLISRIETGQRFPSRDFAERADAVLRAGGSLVRAWNADEAGHTWELTRHRLMTSVLRESGALSALPESRMDLAEVDRGVRDLAVGYLGRPATPVLEQAAELRREITTKLRAGAHRPSEHADLLLAAGRLSGVLAYAALDLGGSQAATAHAAAAWRCADLLGDDELRAWVRGTQSLVARFDGDYVRALDFATEGQSYSRRGTSIIRLLCGEAQCWANLGDPTRTHHALDRALAARDHQYGDDDVAGLFEFSEAKQHYYAGSSLIWLTDPRDAVRAQAEARLAISVWQQEPRGRRSLDDEALAHVYLATARLQCGEPEGAMEALRTVLDLPPERRISWIAKRLRRVAHMLRSIGSPVAGSGYEELRSFGV